VTDAQQQHLAQLISVAMLRAVYGPAPSTSTPTPTDAGTPLSATPSGQAQQPTAARQETDR
jgi:hypothetical protein